jgi:hypothetical protein
MVFYRKGIGNGIRWTDRLYVSSQTPSTQFISIYPDQAMGYEVGESRYMTQYRVKSGNKQYIYGK